MTALKEMTKGERLVAEILGEIPSKSELILTDKHPFLRKIIPFIESRKYWSGSATELLAAIGDNATPPNTVTKLLNRFDYDCFYKKDIIYHPTPHLTEEEIKARFLDAFNALVSDKERLLDECRTMQAALTDTGSLDSEIAALLSEMEVVAELTKRCIEENSTTAQDQATYLERYNGLAERYETAKVRLEKLQAAKAQREAKAEDIGGFMFELAEYGESLTEFDDRLWLTVIDTVTVHRDGQLTFKFQTGHEMLE